jgi:hypothetical protein
LRFGRNPKMAVVGEVTYVRRFAGKFVEILAAGIGTAVSGYLVAYIAGHFSLTMPTAAETPAPQATGWSAVRHDTASIESTVRAALASHDVSHETTQDATPAAPVVATAQPLNAQPSTTQTLTPASPDTTGSIATVAPPLAAAEVRSLPVAASVDAPLAAEQDGWPAGPSAMSGASRLPVSHSLGMLPPQPPPVNGNLFTALKHFF